MARVAEAPAPLPTSPGLGRVGMSTLSRGTSEPTLAASFDSAAVGGVTGSPTGSFAPSRLAARADMGRTAPAGFLARQLSHPSVEARRSLAVKHHELIEDRRVEENSFFFGAKGVKGFRRFLEKQYGSVTAAWRTLDSNGNGRLSFAEFCSACRRLGYHGNMAKLWKELDPSDRGHISVGDIAPDVDETVGAFKVQLMHTYGDMLTAWRKGLDVKGGGLVQEAEVEECCKRLGLSLDSKKLYDMLRGSNERGLILREFDPQAYERWLTSDLKPAGKEVGCHDALWPSDVLKHRWDAEEKGMLTRTELWRQDALRRKLQREGPPPGQTSLERGDCGLRTAADLKKVFVQKYGSLFNAWRRLLDVEDRGKVTFGHFSKVWNQFPLQGDLQTIWQQLDTRDNGVIELCDLDPKSDLVLSEFREKCVAEYGNMMLAWMKGVDTAGKGHCDEARFVKFCQDIGFVGDGAGSDERDAGAKQLFAMLKSEGAPRLMYLRDFDTKAHAAHLKGDFRMLSELGTSHQMSKSSMSFDERSQASCYFQKVRAFQASLSDEFAKSCHSTLPAEPQYGTAEEFLALCRRKHGSVVAAWRFDLDPENAGKLNNTSFCAATRRLGYSGDLQELWKKHDPNGKGFVCLQDFDEAADRMIKDFFDLVDRRYGGRLEGFWKEAGKDLHKSLTAEDICDMCKKIGYPHDARKLFKCLSPRFGATHVSFWDLQPLSELALKALQGQTKMSRALHAYSTASSFSAMRTASPSSPSRPSQTGRGVNITMRTPEILRHNMATVYGSTVAAWCIAFDPQSRGFVTFCQFCAALQKCELFGNVQGLWKQLAGEGDSLTFRAIDPKSQEMLDAFREHLVSTYGTLREAWAKGLGGSPRKKLNKDDFVKACEAMKVPPAVKADVVYGMLLQRIGQVSVGWQDCRALLIGIRPADQAALWGADLAAAGASPKAAPAAAQGGPMVERQDVGVRSARDLRELLVAKFGSPYAAWRRALDKDQNGVVTLFDFCEACREMGVVGPKRLFGELDAGKTGQIRLEDFDAETARGLREFETLMQTRFDHPRKGWRKLFDPEKRTRCDEEHFVSGCKALGYSGDGARLFKLLLPDLGRSFLTYDDIWLDINRNQFKTSTRDVKSLLKSGRQNAAEDNGDAG